jgi:hypothetical protein
MRCRSMGCEGAAGLMTLLGVAGAYPDLRNPSCISELKRNTTQDEILQGGLLCRGFCHRV